MPPRRDRLWRVSRLGLASTAVVACGGASAREPARVQERPGLPYVEARGRGPINVVLIPCHGCDWRSWEPFMSRNADRYRMFAVTLPGMGGHVATRIPEIDTTAPRDLRSDAPMFDAGAEAVAELIRTRAAGRAVVVAHSLGVYVALRLASLHPEVVTHLVIEDEGAVRPPNVSADRAERLRKARARRASVLGTSDSAFHADLRRGMSEQLTSPMRLPTYLDMMDRLDRVASAHYSEDVQSVDLRAALAGLRVPVLGLFAGLASDRGGERGREVQAVIGGASAVSIRWFPGSGHWIHEDRPAEFDDAVAGFLGERGGRTPRDSSSSPTTRPVRPTRFTSR